MLPDMMLVATGMAMAFKLRGEAALRDHVVRRRLDLARRLPRGDELGRRAAAAGRSSCWRTTSTPTRRRLDQQFAVDPVERAAAYGFPGVTVDGNDAEAMFEATRDRARARARRRGPDADRGGDDADARPRRPRRHEVRARRSWSRSGSAQGPDRPPGGAAAPSSASTSTPPRRGPAEVDRRRAPRRRWRCRCPTRRRRPTACSARARRSCSATAPRRGPASRADARLMPDDDLPAGDLRRPARGDARATSASS